MRQALPLLILLTTTAALAQIPIRSVSSLMPVPQGTAYDSTRNFVGDDVNQYRGQVLYVKGLDAKARRAGYDGFYARVPESSADIRNVYKRGGATDRFNTRYDALAQRYFKVVDVVRRPASGGQGYIREVTYLKLIDRDNSETIYFAYDPKYEFRFPFVVQGYFEKLRSIWTGKRFILRRTAGINALGIVNPRIKPGDTLTCTGFFVEDRAYSLVASLKRADGEELLVDRVRFADEHNLFALEAAATYVAKYGVDRFRAIIEGLVQRGMDRQMCELAWGKPENVNRIVHQRGDMEQWVYPSGHYLYFENDTLSTVQE